MENMEREYVIESKQYMLENIQEYIINKNSLNQDYIYRLPRKKEFLEDMERMNFPKNGRVFGLISEKPEDKDNGFYIFEDISSDLSIISLNDKDDVYSSSSYSYSVALIKEKRLNAKLVINITMSDNDLGKFNLEDLKISSNGISLNRNIHIPKRSISHIVEYTGTILLVNLFSGTELVIEVLENDVDNSSNYIYLNKDSQEEIFATFDKIKDMIMKEDL